MLFLKHIQILFYYQQSPTNIIKLFTTNQSYHHSGTHLRKAHQYFYIPLISLYNLLLKNIGVINIKN